MNWQVGLYAAAVLIPLAAFAVEVIFIRQLKRLNAYLATGAIGLSCLLSLVGFIDYYVVEARASWPSHHAAAEAGEGAAAGEHQAQPARADGGHEATHGPLVWQASFDWVLLGSPSSDGQHGRPAGRAGRSRFRWASTSTTCRRAHVPDGHVHRDA